MMSLIGVVVSKSTISRALNSSLRLTRKRITAIALEKFTPVNMVRYILWKCNMLHWRCNDWVFVDEWGFSNTDMNPSMGRSRAGTPCMQAEPLTKSARLSFITAMSATAGVLPCSLPWIGGVNAIVFEVWVASQLIPAILATYPNGTTVVMDNASFHR
jgi:hypothetical protein